MTKSDNCPILDLHGVARSNIGHSETFKNPKDNWVKKVCEGCPLEEGCLEEYIWGKKYPLGRAGLIRLINYLIEVIKK